MTRQVDPVALETPLLSGERFAIEVELVRCKGWPVISSIDSVTRRLYFKCMQYLKWLKAISKRSE